MLSRRGNTMTFSLNDLARGHSSRSRRRCWFTLAGVQQRAAGGGGGGVVLEHLCYRYTRWRDRGFLYHLLLTVQEQDASWLCSSAGSTAASRLWGYGFKSSLPPPKMPADTKMGTSCPLGGAGSRALALLWLEGSRTHPMREKGRGFLKGEEYRTPWVLAACPNT